MLSRLIELPLVITIPASSCWNPCPIPYQHGNCDSVWDFLHQYFALQLLQPLRSNLDLGSLDVTTTDIL